MFGDVRKDASRVYIKNQYLRDRAISTGFRIERGYSCKRGFGYRVTGKGVKDHFIADHGWLNNSETFETLIRIMTRIHNIELRLHFF